ncbi:MAG: hypothetical protein V4472_25090 [Pseudomonadota bacterium]
MSKNGGLGPHKGPLEKKVHAYLDKNYPRSDTSFVCRSAWEKGTVPLARIAYGKRPGGRDPNKVARMAAKLAKGWKPKRVVLIDPGSDGKMVPVDGYHRLLAMAHEGVKEARAYVGSPRPGAGDWRADMTRMQASAENATGLEDHGG